MADEKKKEFHYGGQAVIEGVVMRGPKDFAVAVRRSNGEIISTVESVDSILGRFKWLDRPFLRGTLALIDAMGLGIKALLYSANIAMQDAIEEEEKAKAQKAEKSSEESQAESNSEAISKVNDKKQSKVNDIAVGFTVVLGLLLGLGIFFLVPIIITKPLSNIIHVKWQLTAIEGAVKICIFILYILGISLLPDIRRIFQYHGAEHKDNKCLRSRSSA